MCILKWVLLLINKNYFMPTTPHLAYVRKLNELKEKLSKEKDPVEIAKLQAEIKRVQEALEDINR